MPRPCPSAATGGRPLLSGGALLLLRNAYVTRTAMSQLVLVAVVLDHEDEFAVLVGQDSIF